MKFEDRIFNFISERGLITSDDKVLLGVSGGADSVCLFRVLVSFAKKGGFGLAAVHVNHMIRGAEADGDRQFVEELCGKYGVKCYSFNRNVPALSKKLGVSEEEAGRQVRYEIFDEVAQSEGYTKIAVAHHKNDLAETVIFNMTRGSGLSGLSGISSVRENIIRPLICVNRQEIEAYLEDIGQNFRTDSTNSTLDYTRNKIRHNIIPALEELNSEAVEHIAALAMDAEIADGFIRTKAEDAYEAAAVKTGMAPVAADISKAGKQSICLDIPTLKLVDTVVLYNLIHNSIVKAAGKKKDITRHHVDAVAGLLNAETGKQVMLPYGLTARRSYDRLIIEHSEGINLVNNQDNKYFGVNPDACEYSSKNGPGVSADREKIVNFKALEEGNVTVDLECVPEILKVKQPQLEFALVEQPYDDKIFMEKNVYTKIFSYDKISAKNSGGICIRNGCDGDYIVITSDGKTKKLNRVFIDAKTDRTDREIWPLVAIGNELLWVVGLRYNEAYRVTENTKKILKITYKPNSDLG